MAAIQSQGLAHARGLVAREAFFFFLLNLSSKLPTEIFLTKW